MTDDGPKLVSLQATFLFGCLTAVLLLIVLAQDLRANLRSRWNEGNDRATEAALGVAQMVRSPLRSSANTVLLIAQASRREGQAAGPNGEAMNDMIAAMLQRQPQIVGLTFADSTAATEASVGVVPDSRTWTSCEANSDMAIAVPCFGPVQGTPAGSVLPLASSIDEHRWVVGQIRLSALERAVAHAPDADVVAFAIVDARGRSVVHGGLRSQAPARTTPPAWVQWLVGSPALAPLEASAPTGSYPFTVLAQIDRAAILASWRHHAAVAASFFLLYLAAFACLLLILAHTARLQRHYIQSLQAKSQQLRLAQRAGRTAMWSLDKHAQHFHCQEDTKELLGLPGEHALVGVRELLAMVLPADRWRLLRHVTRAWGKQAPLRAEFRIQQPDGSMRRLSASGQVVLDANGAKHLTGTAVDITEQWSARQRQAESEHRFEVLFEQNPLPFWVFDAVSLKFLEVNAAAVRAYGYSREEFLRMTILDIRDPSERQKVQEDTSAPQELRSIPKIWAHRTKHGTVIDVRVHTADIVFADRPARLVLAEDVTTQLADERELAYRASHDLVTGLPNQHALIERIDALIAGGARFEMAYLQLLGMDAIADTFGINVATGILQVMAARFAELADGNGYLAVVTQQAFVWVSAGGPMADATLQAVTDSVTEPIYYKDTQHQLNIMVGVARHPEDGAQSDALLARAALAAHVHLRSERPVHYFEPALAQQSREKLHFSACLRRAVKRHEFELYFQPITAFSPMQPLGLEALIRWPQADGTLILPSAFIPICEEAGLIVPLGNWVLNQAAKASRELRQAGFGNLPIAINVSPAELRGRDLVANIRSAREAYALASDALRVELTESCLIEHKDKAIAVMKQLRDEGVAVALDDFGTGFSSLAYLRDLPIDTLKIDQAFVREVDRDQRSALICEAIIALGKSLKVNIIAEGIERYAQFRWLQSHGCDAAQGFYIGRPQRLQDLLTSLAQYKDRAI